MEKLPALVLSSLFAAAFLALVIGVADAAFNIRSGTSCNAGETCLFSTYNLSNAHAGACTYYTNYSVCTNEVNAVIRSTGCIAGESSLLSFLPANLTTGVNNSHIGSRNENTIKLCATPSNYTCAVRSSCTAGQACMGSVSNSSNAHFAECNFYSNQVCCGYDNTPPTISNEAINTTSVLPGEAVRFTATVTDDFEIMSSVLVTVIFPNSTTKNYSMSILSGSTFYLDFIDTSANGVYTWSSTYANDTTGNAVSSFPQLTFRSRGITYKVQGRAADLYTGEVISTGTAIASIKENGDSGTASIVNGAYNIELKTSLDTNETRFTVGIILTSGSKTGYTQVVMGRGDSFASLIQTCDTKTWRFKGYASDAVSGARINSGSSSVSVVGVKGTLYTNSTSFSNGQWDVAVSPCVLSGEVYNFDISVSDSGGSRISQFSVSQVAS